MFLFIKDISLNNRETPSIHPSIRKLSHKKLMKTIIKLKSPHIYHRIYYLVSTMNLNESHSYVCSFGRLFGLCYLSNSENRLKVTNKPLLVGLTFALAIIFAFYSTRFEPLDQASYGNTNSIMFIVVVFGILAQFLNCIIILISSLNQRQRVFKFYKKLNNLDMTLQSKLGIQFDYKKLKNNNLKDLLIVSVIYIIISCVINYVYVRNITYFTPTLVFTFVNGAEIMSSYDYYYSTKLIKYRFRALNGYLIDSMENFKINPCQLEAMIRCHSTLNNLINDFNQMYGLKKLLGITNDFVLILSQFYGIFMSIEDNIHRILHIKFLCGIMTIPSLIFKMAIITKTCQDTVAAKNKFGKLLKAYNKMETNFNQTISELVIYSCSIYIY